MMSNSTITLRDVTDTLPQSVVAQQMREDTAKVYFFVVLASALVYDSRKHIQFYRERESSYLLQFAPLTKKYVEIVIFFAAETLSAFYR
jgi:hypothetical protein